MVGLCERFHCLPSQLYAEDAELLRLIDIRDYGKEEEEVSPDGE